MSAATAGASSAPVARTTHASGLECVTLRHPDGARVTVTLHGANVLEWTAPGSSENILFVSKEAVFNGKKAIRGGIPLVFPQFGAGLDGETGLPSHGFARISKWTFAGGGQDGLSFEAAPFGGTVFAEFTLASDDVHDPEHASPWLNGAIAFRLTLRVELGPGSLSTSLTIANTHDDAKGAEAAPFKYQALFHTYYSVPDSTAVEVDLAAPASSGDGGQSLHIHDKMTPEDPHREVGAPHTQAIDKEVDRIFHSVAPTIGMRINDTAAATTPGARLVVVKVRNVVSSAPARAEPVDAVVWNPWVAKAHAMGDFGDDEYKTMICVEPGRVAANDHLAPGQWARMDQRIFVRDQPAADEASL